MGEIMRELVLFNLKKKFFNKMSMIIIILEFIGMFIVMNCDLSFSNDSITTIKIDKSVEKYQQYFEGPNLNFNYDKNGNEEVVLYNISGQWMIESEIVIDQYQRKQIEQDLLLIEQKEYLKSHQFLNDFFKEYNNFNIRVNYNKNNDKENIEALVICTICYLLLMNYSNLLSTEFLYQKNSGVINLLLNNMSVKQHFFSNIIYGYLVEIINVTIISLIALINIVINNKMIDYNSYQIVEISLIKCFLVILVIITALFLIQIIILIITSSFSNSSTATNFIVCVNALYLIIYYISINYLNKEIIGHFFIKFISFLPVLSMILMPYRIIVDNNYLSAIFYFALNSLVIYLLIKKGLVIYKKNLLK